MFSGLVVQFNIVIIIKAGDVKDSPAEGWITKAATVARPTELLSPLLNKRYALSRGCRLLSIYIIESVGSAPTRTRSPSILYFIDTEELKKCRQ